jgi:hypothetical protein
MLSTAIENRLRKLEADHAPSPSRIYAVKGGLKDADVAAFVRSQGHAVDDADVVVHLPLVRPSPDGPVYVDAPMEMMWTPTLTRAGEPLALVDVTETRPSLPRNDWT